MAKRDGDGLAGTGWSQRWIAGVADGTFTMSRRKRSAVEARGGGLAAVRRLAEANGVHLLLLTGDRGAELVAASRSPFQVIC